LFDLDIEVYYLITLIIILTTFLTFIHFYFRKFAKTLDITLHNIQSADVHFDKHELSSYELQRLEREESFDSRIAELKEELALQQNIIRHGVIAEELHPNVHNLPHEIIDHQINSLPDVEISE
jgi:predicted Holliday junction resolvase-like endonuclease